MKRQTIEDLKKIDMSIYNQFNDYYKEFVLSGAENVKNKKFDDDKLHKAWFTTDDADAVFEEKQTLAPEIGRKIAGNTTLTTTEDSRRISH